MLYGTCPDPSSSHSSPEPTAADSLICATTPIAAINQLVSDMYAENPPWLDVEHNVLPGTGLPPSRKAAKEKKAQKKAP